MRRFLWFVFGLVVGVVLTLGIPALVIEAGGIGMSAIEGPRGIEKLVGPWVYDRWVQTHAKNIENPLRGNAAAQAAGLEHYEESCVLCHAAPGVKLTAIARGLDPYPPNLWEEDSQEMTDGQLFLVAKEGVRMTGMPAFGVTHSDQEIWQMVAFIRHLPQITPQEQKKLREAVESRAH